MIHPGCWAGNKCVYAQLDGHHFTTQSDSLSPFLLRKKVKSRHRRPAPARAWRHFLTSAFTSHFNCEYQIWQNTQRALRESSSPPPRWDCLTGVNTDSFTRLWWKIIIIIFLKKGDVEKLPDESPRENFLAIPCNRSLKGGVKMHLPQQDILPSPVQTQSVLGADSSNTRS